ncbi:hypothetical protein FA13DRAFT_1519559 [Coprinellus micaceus]|uniref:F-box domain-containing protein n=1 Tax=Coprinellus micaceus TaxID=71717 RepID=A0A4Y7SKB0_COPMI|nr:hypothetical protein FA13DRAFT_1519559 [Coprinellus micaceus]
MTSDAPSFECIGLPGDLWIEVALDADPLDVMSLSQTCRILHSLLSEGSVWKAILREDMRRNGPFIVSYSLDELTLDELQRAATRSERWRRFSIKRALSPGAWNMDATLETGKSLRDCSDVRPTNANLTQRLIPGGRFLLTSGVSNPFLRWGEHRGDDSLGSRPSQFPSWLEVYPCCLIRGRTWLPAVSKGAAGC